MACALVRTSSVLCRWASVAWTTSSTPAIRPSAWSSWADQDLVGGQQLVGVGEDLDASGVQQQEVVADPLQVADEMGRQDDGRGRLGDGVDHGGEELPAGEWVEAGEGFVEEQQAWPLGKREAQRHLGALAARKPVDAPVEWHADLRQAFPAEGDVEVAVELVAHREQLAGGEVPVQRGVLGNEADTWQCSVSRFSAEHPDRARGWSGQPGGAVQQGRLAGPVGADEGNDRPFGDRKAAVVERERPSVALRDAVGDQRVAHAESLMSSNRWSVVSTTALMCSGDSPAACAWPTQVSKRLRSPSRVPGGGPASEPTM